MLHYKKKLNELFELFIFLLPFFLFFLFLYFLSLEWQWAADMNLLIIWNCNLTNKWTCKCCCKCLSSADFKAWSLNIWRFKAQQGLTGLAVMMRREEMVVTAWPQDAQQTPKNLLATQGNCWNIPVAVEVLTDHNMCCFGPVGFLSSQHASPCLLLTPFPTTWQVLAALSGPPFQTMEWPEVSHPESFPPCLHFGKAPWASITLSQEPQWKVMEELTLSRAVVSTY